MTGLVWSSAICPQRPPVPRLTHWGAGLTVALLALTAATWAVASSQLPEDTGEGAELESMIVSLGAPAQRLEPPPPPPEEAPPPPEIPPEPQVPTERAEDAPPPAPPPQPRQLAPQLPNTGRLSSGFGHATGDPAPPAPPPRPVELQQRFIDISTAAYVAKVRYPYNALRARIEGQGKIVVVIDRTGAVRDWRLVESTGSALLDREIERVAGSVDRLDPLPDYYTRPTATLVIPFIFIME